MKAKDTVISWERIRMITADNDKHNRRGECRIEEYCKVQAEISFKAGQEEERNSWLLKTDSEKARDNFTKDIILRTRWQALKEVVEWIEKTSKAGQPSKFIPSSEWEAFKKGGDS